MVDAAGLVCEAAVLARAALLTGAVVVLAGISVILAGAVLLAGAVEVPVDATDLPCVHAAPLIALLAGITATWVGNVGCRFTYDGSIHVAAVVK